MGKMKGKGEGENRRRGWRRWRGWRRGYLYSRGCEAQDADLGADISGDTEVDAVVEGGVAHEVESVGLEDVEAIHAHPALDQAAAVGRLHKPGHSRHPKRHAAVHHVERSVPVLDLHLVRVVRGEQQRDVQRQVRSRRSTCSSSSRPCYYSCGGYCCGGDEEVLDGYLLEIELGLLRLEGEEDDEGDGDGEEGEEGEKEEEAAAAALEGSGSGRG